MGDHLRGRQRPEAGGLFTAGATGKPEQEAGGEQVAGAGGVDHFATGKAGDAIVSAPSTTTQPFSLRVTTANRASARKAASAASKSDVR